MARESHFIEEIRQPTPPSYEVVHSTHADVIVDTFVQVLRECFSKHPLYTYVPLEESAAPDFERTSIVIVDQYTEEALFLPVITMNINNINTKWLQFSQTPFATVLKPQMSEDGSVKRDSRGNPLPSHWEYTGAYDGQLSFLISGNDPLEREELSNQLHVIFAEIQRDELYKRGIFIKNVNTSGYTVTQYMNDNIYQASVSVDVYSEWSRKIPVGDTLKAVGLTMEVVGEPIIENDLVITSSEDDVTVESTDTLYSVIDDETQAPIVPLLLLSATEDAAPATLIFNPIPNRWEVSPFWLQVMNAQLIPFESLDDELTKKSTVDEYLKEAAQAILQAESLRGLALSSGRKLFDGTIVIGRSFVFEDGRVQLQGGLLDDPVIYSTMVEADNTVIFRSTVKNLNRHVIVIKDVTVDGYGTPVTGAVYKRIAKIDENNNTIENDHLVVSSEETYLDGESFETMTAVDLFMIFQFTSQLHRYTKHAIIKEIDKLINELADMSINILDRSAKLTNITNVKQELIQRTEKYLVSKSTGL